MVTMIFIGLFVAITRFIMQYEDIKGLAPREQLQIGAVYGIGMVVTFMLGSYIIDWTKIIAAHSIIQTSIFIVMFTAIFLVMQLCMQQLLPVSLRAEQQRK